MIVRIRQKGACSRRRQRGFLEVNCATFGESQGEDSAGEADEQALTSLFAANLCPILMPFIHEISLDLTNLKIILSSQFSKVFCKSQ